VLLLPGAASSRVPDNRVNLVGQLSFSEQLIRVVKAHIFVHVAASNIDIDTVNGRVVFAAH